MIIPMGSKYIRPLNNMLGQKSGDVNKWESYFKAAEEYSGERKIWMEFELLNRCLPNPGNQKIALPKNITLEIIRENAPAGCKITARKLDAAGNVLEKNEYLQEFEEGDKNKYYVTKNPGAKEEKIYYQTDGKTSQILSGNQRAEQIRKQKLEEEKRKLKEKIRFAGNYAEWMFNELSAKDKKRVQDIEDKYKARLVKMGKEFFPVAILALNAIHINAKKSKNIEADLFSKYLQLRFKYKGWTLSKKQIDGLNCLEYKHSEILFAQDFSYSFLERGIRKYLDSEEKEELQIYEPELFDLIDKNKHIFNRR